MKRLITLLAFHAAASLAAPVAAQGSPAPHGVTPPAAVFAVVNGTTISASEFDGAYAMAVRRKYYHKAPPEGELADFQREVGDKLIERVLLLAEGQRQRVKPDVERVRERIAAHESRYGGSPQWQKNRDTVLPQLQRELEQQTVLERLEQKVRAGPEPTDNEVRNYYALHPELFTEPERVRLSVILLKVDPSATRAAWDKAREEAAGIVKRLAAGADFSELARLHSGDSSAKDGGDMGYVHRGMLPETVHQVVDKLKPGMVSEPLTLLEGVAVVRLAERKAAHLMVFGEVQKRATELWKREQSDRRWKELNARLRKTADIQIVDTSRYPQPHAAAPARRAEKTR